MKSFHPTTLNFLELLEHKPTTEKILSGQSEIGKSKLILRILNELCKPAPVGSKARSMKNVEKQSSVKPLVGLRFSKNHRGWGIKIFLSKWEGEVIYIGGRSLLCNMDRLSGVSLLRCNTVFFPATSWL